MGVMDSPTADPHSYSQRECVGVCVAGPSGMLREAMRTGPDTTSDLVSMQAICGQGITGFVWRGDWSGIVTCHPSNTTDT